MADPFGISFAPTSDGAQPNGGARPSPIQQAIQTLSFKIPRVAGASAFTAQPLLTAQGGDALGGNPNSAALLEQIRRMLFGQQGGQQQGGGADQGGTNFSQMFGMPDTTLTGGPSGGNLGAASASALVPRIEASSPQDSVPRDPEIPALPADTTTTTGNTTQATTQNNFNNGQDRRDRYA